MSTSHAIVDAAAASAPKAPAQSHGRLVARLLALIGAAFLFAFAMVPLYNVLCEATGFNGKAPGGFSTGGLNAAAKPVPYSPIDRSRSLRVEFMGTVMPGLPWDMRPLTPSLDVHPGEMQMVRYLVRNTSSHTVVAQAVPSISPGQAAQYFEKIECFCFTQQTLAPGQSVEMPLVFIVKPDIGQDISQITLSYAFFSVDGQRQTLTRDKT